MVGPKHFILGGLAAVALGGTVFAADLPAKGPFYKAPPVAYFWDGWYVGAHAGYAWGKTNIDTFIAGPEAIEPAGGFGGLQTGFLRHLNSNWVLGFEVDITAGDVSTARQNLDYFGTARTRLGYVQGPWLLYATGGVAWAWSEIQPVGGLDGQKLPHVGWAAGAGVEYALNPSWTIRAEYLFADLDRVTTVRGAVVVPEDVTLSMARLAINYRFGEVRSVRAHGYAPEAPARYVSNWTGVYVGVHGGYAWGTQVLDPFAGAVASVDQDGGFAGFQSGANWQFAPNWLVGVEADSSWGTIKGNSAGADAKIDTLGTVRGRLGYVMNNWVLYGTGGLAWAKSIAHVPGDTAHDRYLLGFVGGLGLEYALSDRWSLKAEYLYADFSTNRVQVNTDAETQRADLQTFKIGLNYRASLWEALLSR